MVKSGILRFWLWEEEKKLVEKNVFFIGFRSPGEFPWSCLLLTEENGFVGNCALIPGWDLEKIEQRGYSTAPTDYEL